MGRDARSTRGSVVMGASIEGDVGHRSSKLEPEVPRGTPAEAYPQRMNCATGAQLLGVSYSWLRKKTQGGLCPAVVRHGRVVTYDKTMLLAWNTSDSSEAE